MADSSKERGSLRALKATVTRTCNNITDFLKHEIRSYTVIKCSDYEQKLAHHFTKYEAAVEAFCGNWPDEADAVLKSLDESQTKCNDIYREIASYVASIEAEANRNRISLNETIPVNSSPYSPVSKADKTIRPFILTQDHKPQDLRRWSKKLHKYFLSGSIAQQSLEVQQAYFEECIDENILNSISKFISPITPIFGPDGCTELVEDFFATLYPIFNRRFEYFRLMPEKGEFADSYLSRLELLHIEADSELMDADETLIFLFLSHYPDKKIRERVSQVKKVTLNELRKIVKHYVQLQRTERALEEKNAASVGPVNAVQPQQRQVSSNQSSFPKANRNSLNTGLPPSRYPTQPRPSRPQRYDFRPQNPNARQCTRCGNFRHSIDQCRVLSRNIFCQNCERHGHIATSCNVRQRGAQRIAQIDFNNDLDPDLDGVDNEPTVTPRLPLSFSHACGTFTFNSFPDTGSVTSLISRNLATKFKIEVLPCKPGISFIAINGDPIKVNGKAILNVSAPNGITAPISFIISEDVKNDVLIGYSDLKELKVISDKFPIASIKSSTYFNQKAAIALKSSLIERYPEVLSGNLPSSGIKGDRMKIFLNNRDDIPPTKVLTARPIPIHYQKEADILIKKALDEGIIARVDAPTEWCALAFFVQKPNGGLRLVTDFTGLNRRVQRPTHPFPSSFDIISGLDPDAKVFAKLDALSGYHQVELTEKASFMTTFLLPSGRYRYLRAPMGLSSSSDEFCRRSDAVLTGISGMRKLVDDILVGGKDMADLESKLITILDRCSEHGFVLSKKKFEIGTSVEFAGFQISAGGITPSHKKLEAIANFPTPSNVSSLRSFLGLTNQLRCFVPNLSKITEVLQGLLKKNVAFQWLPDHQESFENAKSELLKELSLHHFSPNLNTKLITDASRLYGIGFALLQYKPGDDKPSCILQCGSRSLSMAEKNYSTIELECLGIQWAMHKCSHFLRGLSSFRVLTDHRPLVGIFAKPLSEIDNPRLLRYRERMLAYSFEVQWLPGKANIIADTFSRFPASKPPVGTVPIRACLLGQSLLVDKIKAEAKTCSAYTSIFGAFSNGKHPSQLPEAHPARTLLSVWDTLSAVDDNLLCINTKQLFVPTGCRKDVLEKLHLSHGGMTRLYNTARSIYYWPGMKNNIRQVVDSCIKCQLHRPKLPNDALIPTIASMPMEMTSADLFQVDQAHYLLLVDRYSGFPFISKLSSLTSRSVIIKLREWFELFGYPRTIRTDGGPQFRSEFAAFCRNFSISHETSSPYHPRSNGSAEASVKNMKNLLIKSTPSTFAENLSIWRNTCSTKGESPAFLFFGRRLRTSVPVLSTFHPLTPQNTEPSIRVDKLRSIAIGTCVRVQNPRTGLWSDVGVISATNPIGRSYEIQLQDGTCVVRNRRFLKVKY